MNKIFGMVKLVEIDLYKLYCYFYLCFINFKSRCIFTDHLGTFLIICKCVMLGLINIYEN